MAGKLGAPMTEEEFLNELRRITKAGTTWVLERGQIRVPPQAGQSWGFSQCPLTAVANDLHGGSLGVHEVSSAAFALGMNEPMARAIAKAADAGPGHDAALRARLIKVCGPL